MDNTYGSPTEEIAEEVDAEKRVAFRFCRECSNMLYPREDREAGTLAFQCRHCNYMEDVGPTCIYRNELSYTVGETSGVTQDVASDPTVGASVRFLVERPLTLITATTRRYRVPG